MDRDEALRLLRGGEEGIREWNRRREEGEEVPFLRSANLRGADLRGTNLSEANFRRADLRGTNLSEADLRGAVLSDANLNVAILRGANLRGADLRGANLSDADLRGADLRGANLRGADLCTAVLHGADLSGADLRIADLRSAGLRDAVLSEADLTVADLRGAKLSAADLSDAILNHANFSGANLSATNFENVHCYHTIFQGVDLSDALGFDSIQHNGPSGISTSTLVLSKGRIPIEFLKGCGLADWEIEAAKLYQPDLRNDEVLDIQQEVFRLRSQGALQINSLFISYSHANADFVDTIEKRLDEKGIRFWRDVHDMKAGRLEKQIDRGMRLNPTVLLVFSKDSVESDWVEWEVSQARKLEKELKRDVLCPVALDDSWKTCDWPGPLRRQIMDYNILDFSAWQEEDVFDRQFEKLVDGLGLFYRGDECGS